MRRPAPFFFVAIAALAIGWFARPWFDRSMSAGHGTGGARDEKRPLFYQSAMHPWIKSDKPGKCTICGMDLSPVYEVAGGSGDSSGLVTLDGAAERVLDVRTVEVKQAPIVRTLRFAGTLQEDDTRRRILSAPMDGRVEQLFFSYAGQEVKAGQPLALVSGQMLMMAVRNHLMFRAQPAKSPPDEAATNLRNSARMRLRQLGLSDMQIDQLPGVMGDESMNLEIQAPAAGVVVSKSVNEGQMVKEGDKLYELANLDVLWLRFDAYEQDLAWLRPGQKVHVTTPAVRGRTFEGEIGFLEPRADERTRSVRVTVELPNPITETNGVRRHLLTPGVFAQAAVLGESPSALAVPRLAVLNPDGRPVVYVRKESGAFERRPVVLGRLGDEMAEVVSGVAAGEQVVATGGLLIDSQAQMSGSFSPGPPLPAPLPAMASDSGPSAVAPQHHAALEPLFAAAVGLGAALSADDLAAFNARSPGLRKLAFDASQALATETNLSLHAAAAAEAALWPAPASLAQARQRFHAFVTPLSLLARALPDSARDGAKVKVFRCPMTKNSFPGAPKESFWLQAAGPVRNPYHGAAMLECGMEVK